MLFISWIINAVTWVTFLSPGEDPSVLTYTMVHSFLITCVCVCVTVIYQLSTSFQTLERIKASSLDFTALRRTHLCYDVCHLFDTVYQPVILAYMTQMSPKPNDTSLIAHYLSDGFSQYCKAWIQRLWERDFTIQQIGHLYPHSCLLSFFFPVGGFETEESLDNLLRLSVLGLATPMGHTHGPWLNRLM